MPCKTLSEEELNRQFPFALEDHDENIKKLDSIKCTNHKQVTNLRVKDLHADKDLFNSTEVNNVELTSCGKLHLTSNVEYQELSSKRNLSPPVKIYSSSSRLDAKLKPLSHKSKLKSSEQTFVHTISNENTFNGNCEGDFSHLKSNPTNNLISKSCNKNLDKNKGNLILEDASVYKQNRKGNNHESKYQAHHEAVKESIPDILTCMSPGLELHPGSIDKKNSSLQHSTTFPKVAEWEKSLQPLEIVEPSCYGSFDCGSNRSKTVNHNLKKFTSPGCDSGCPDSELCNSSFQTNSKFPVHHVTNLNQDTLKCLLSQNQESLLRSNIYSSVSNNHTAVNNVCSPPQFNVESNTDLNSSKSSEVSSHLVLQSPLIINTCECWLLEKPLDNDKKSSESNADRKCDFGIPPLKLGSLIDDSSDITDTNYGNDTSNISENEIFSNSYTVFDESLISSQQDTSKDITSSSIVTPVSERKHSNRTGPINFSNILKNMVENKNALEEVHINYGTADINMKHGLLLQSDLAQPTANISYKSEQSSTKTTGNRLYKKSQSTKLDYSLPSTPTSYKNVKRTKTSKFQPEVKQQDNINDSIEPTATTSTSYMSLQPCKSLVENSTIEQNCIEDYEVKSACVEESYTQCSCTSEPSKQTYKSQIPHTQHPKTNKQTQINKCCNSTHDQRQSDASKKRILGIALRILLTHFLNNTEKCNNNNNCICSRLMKHNVSSVNTQTQTDEASLYLPSYNLQDKSNSNFKNKVSSCVSSKKKYLATKPKNIKDLKSEISCQTGKVSMDHENSCSNDKIPHCHDEFQYLLCDKVRCKTSTRNRNFKEGESKNEDASRKKLCSCWSNESSPSEQPRDEAHNNLKKCLEEMDHIAQQLSSSSEKILNILAVQKKFSS